MESDYEQLLVRIDAAMEQLRREMTRSDNAIAQSGTNIERSVRRIEQSMERVNRSATVGAGALGAFDVAMSAVGGVIQFTTSALSAAESIADLTLQTGVATDTIQAFRQIADQTGSSTMAADEALRTFGLGLERFTTGQGGPAAAAFEHFEIAVRDANGEILSTDAVFRNAVDQIARLSSEAEQAAAASQFFGDSVGPQLVSAIRPGSAALDEMASHLRETGRLFEHDIAMRAGEASAALRDLKNAATQTLQVAFLEQITDQMGDLRNVATDPAFQAGLSAIGAGLGIIAGEGIEAVKQIGRLVDLLRDPSWSTLEGFVRGTWQGRLFSAFEGLIPDETQRQISSVTAEITVFEGAIEHINSLLAANAITQQQYNADLEDYDSLLTAARERLAALLDTQVAATESTEAGSSAIADTEDAISEATDAIGEYINAQGEALLQAGRNERETLRQSDAYAQASEAQKTYADGVAALVDSQVEASAETQQLTSMLEQMRLEGLEPQERAAEIVSQAIRDMRERLRTAQEAVYGLSIGEVELAAAVEHTARAELAASAAFAAGNATRADVKSASNDAAAATVRHAAALELLNLAQKGLDDLTEDYNAILERRERIMDRLAKRFSGSGSGDGDSGGGDSAGRSLEGERAREIERERDAATRVLEDITRLYQRHTETRLETVRRETSERMAELDRLRDQEDITEVEHSEARIQLITATSAQIREIQEREAREGAKAQADALRLVESAVESTMRSVSSGLIQSLYEGGDAWASFGDTAINVLQRLHDQVMELVVIAPLMNALFDTERTTIANVGGIIGSILGGGGSGGGAQTPVSLPGPAPTLNIPPLVGAGVRHTGGIVGSDMAHERSVPSSLFYGAPRFSDGLMPDEFPAILQRGEGVFTRNQMAAMGGSATITVPVTVHNSAGPDVEATAEERPLPGGGKAIEVFVERTVKKQMANGAFDSTLGRNFGLSRRGAR